jgi:hypothetical protein
MAVTRQCDSETAGKWWRQYFKVIFGEQGSVQSRPGKQQAVCSRLGLLRVHKPQRFVPPPQRRDTRGIRRVFQRSTFLRVRRMRVCHGAKMGKIRSSCEEVHIGLLSRAKCQNVAIPLNQGINDAPRMPVA